MSRRNFLLASSSASLVPLTGCTGGTKEYSAGFENVWSDDLQLNVEVTHPGEISQVIFETRDEQVGVDDVTESDPIAHCEIGRVETIGTPNQPYHHDQEFTIYLRDNDRRDPSSNPNPRNNEPGAGSDTTRSTHRPEPVSRHPASGRKRENIVRMGGNRTRTHQWAICGRRPSRTGWVFPPGGWFDLSRDRRPADSRRQPTGTNGYSWAERRRQRRLAI